MDKPDVKHESRNDPIFDKAIPIDFAREASFATEAKYPEDCTEVEILDAVLSGGLEKMIQWARNANNDRTKVIRLQVLYYFVSKCKTQVELAREIGCTKAAISAQATNFADTFKIERPAGAAANMRSEEARKNMSICKTKTKN